MTSITSNSTVVISDIEFTVSSGKNGYYLLNKEIPLLLRIHIGEIQLRTSGILSTLYTLYGYPLSRTSDLKEYLIKDGKEIFVISGDITNKTKNDIINTALELKIKSYIRNMNLESLKI